MHIMLGVAFRCAYSILLYVNPSPPSSEPSNTPRVCVVRLLKAVSERQIGTMANMYDVLNYISRTPLAESHEYFSSPFQ